MSLISCKNNAPESDETSQVSSGIEPSSSFNPHNGPVPPICSAPPPVKNIWVLEPMLIEKGLITEDMDKEQREAVINNYIKKKNSTYEKCLKGKSQ